ncbi:MAG: hypothetical protein ABL871_11615 [Terricaulis sp.]
MELAKKLQLKTGSSIRVINAPGDVSLDLPIQPKSRNVLLFVAGRAELGKHARGLLATATDADLLWIAYPKKSGAIKADIDRDHGWEPVTEAGWEGVRQVAVDETWSALRFRPVNR